MTRLEKQLAFIKEVDKVKEITRQNYLASGSRREGDAEHQWHLAIMAMILSEHANEEIDVAHVIEMVLVHDLVEIDAGDTYAYDETAAATKRERELRAADRIFPILPDDQAAKIRALWEEFEAGETADAKFANAIDRFQPAFLNASSGGKSWMEHAVTKSQVLNRNKRIAEGAEVLWDVEKKMVDEHVRLGHLKDE